MEVLGISARLNPTSVGIGGLVYMFGGCVLSALFDSDTVIISCWALLMVVSLVVSLVVLAWLKWPRRDKEGENEPEKR